MFFDAIKFHESAFALPFAYMGMTLAADGFPGWRVFAWITVAMVSARTVGMCANRVIDRHIDALNPRAKDRHVPAGLLSAAEMTVAAAAAFAVFMFAAWRLNPLALALAPVAAAYLTLYPFSKRFTWAANLLLGWALAISPSAAWIGVTGSLSWEPVLMSLAVALWAGSFDIIYHTQDVEFHRNQGLHSVASRFGVAAAFRIARVMDVLAVICLVGLGARDGAVLALLRRLRRRVGRLGVQIRAGVARRPVAAGNGVRQNQRPRLARDADGRGAGGLSGVNYKREEIEVSDESR